MDNESVMSCSHCTEKGLGLVQRMELTKQETLGPSPSSLSQSSVNISTLYYTFCLLPVPVPVLVSISLKKSFQQDAYRPHHNKAEQWPGIHEADCGQNDRRMWTLPFLAVGKNYVQTSVNMKRRIFARFLGIFYSLHNILACNHPPSYPLPHSLTALIHLGV